MSLKTSKSFLSGFVWAIILSGFAYANTEAKYAHSERSIEEKVSVNNKEKFFYNKGLTDGYEEGKRVGYELAMRDAKKAMTKYKNRIKALEAGKYISKKGKITPPRIYQEKRTDGTISVVVRGCSIEGELSPQDILMFPEFDGSKDGGMSMTSNPYSQGASSSSGVTNSVQLAGIDYSLKSKPVNPATIKRVTFRTFEDTQFNRQLFRGAGLAFSIQPNKQLRVMFKSNDEAEGFMERHGLVRGKDYK